MRLSRLLPLLLTCALFSVAGCRKSAEVVVTVPTTASLPAGLMLPEAPADGLAVSAVKTTAKEGDTITVTGRIGGRAKPMVAGRAAFMLADLETISACDTTEDDECEFPWDYCCEPKEKITAGTLTVQVADADGRPLKLDLTSAAGLKPGSFVVVTGTVGPRPDPNALVVTATGIFLKP